MRSTLAVIDRAVLLNVSRAARILRSQSTLKHDIAKTSTTSLNANITLIAYGLNKMASHASCLAKAAASPADHKLICHKSSKPLRNTMNQERLYTASKFPMDNSEKPSSRNRGGYAENIG